MTLDTVADEDKTADGVTRSSARFCSRDWKICYYERLEYDFLLLCVAGYFSYFLLPNPGMFIFFGFFRLCSSSNLVLLLYSQQVRMVLYVFLCHLYPAASRNSVVFIRLVFLFVVLVSRVAIFCCALVPSTLALDLPTLIPYVATFVFSLSL